MVYYPPPLPQQDDNDDVPMATEDQNLYPHQYMMLQQQQQQQPMLSHNLIPLHLQQPPPLPLVMTPQQPLYNGVHPQYPGLSMIHADPPVFIVNNFLSPSECQSLIDAASDSFQPAPVVGKGAGQVSASRTSSTCYLAREDLPTLMQRVSLLTGKPVEHCELPQVGRYRPGEFYLQHHDAFDLKTEDGLRFAANGGQRVVTVLIYLTDTGGCTHFPTLNDLRVQPQTGRALVFFPATLEGVLDPRALHAALPCSHNLKYVSQVWIRQWAYHGQASKRLAQPI